MAFLDDIRAVWHTLFGKLETPAPAGKPVARTVAPWLAAGPLAMERDVRALLDEGYRRNVVAYCCVQQLATSAAQPRVLARIPRTHRRPAAPKSSRSRVRGSVIRRRGDAEP